MSSSVSKIVKKVGSAATGAFGVTGDTISGATSLATKGFEAIESIANQTNPDAAVAQADPADEGALTEAQQTEDATTEAKRKSRKLSSGASTILTSPLGTSQASSIVTKLGG